MLRGISFITTVLVLFLINHSYGEERKVYPPYPDKWGYEFPLLDDNDRNSLIKISKMPDGDYFVSYIEHLTWVKRQNEEGRDPVSKHAGVFFFSGEKKTFSSEKEYYDLREKIRSRDVKYEHPIVFNDGSWLELRTAGAYCDRCCPLTNAVVVKKDNKGEVVFRKHLIYLFDKARTKPTSRDCERNWSLDKDHITTMVDKISYALIKLEDNTFLLVDEQGNLVIRFDENLITKSDLINKKVFWVDREIIEDIGERLRDKENDQTLVDEIYKHISTVRKEDEK